MEQLTVEEAQRRLPELLRRAAAGEHITIEDEGRIVTIVAEKRAGEASASPSKAKNLAELFRNSPLRGLNLDFERSKDTGRDIEL
jgi:antitoxin (DNA-binding transcriptional repressor) of toxin-antitoxin stability system